MKLLKLFFFLALVATFSACGDDEESSSCVQSDWVGTYTGTSDCDGDVQDATVTITASGDDAIIIVTDIPGLESEYDPLTVDGCDLEQSATQSGITLSIETSLDGDNLTFTEVIGALGINATCTITATRN